MLTQTLLAAIFGGAVGLALGLTGGGGSIFAVPLLIYGLGLPPAVAAPLSLVAVGTTAAVGGLRSIRHGLVIWQPAILFAMGGVLGAPLGVAVAGRLEPVLLVRGFGVLALTIGTLLWRAALRHPERTAALRARTYQDDHGPICVLAPDGRLHFTTPCAFVLAFVGIATGVLSGLFGVGGGFLIVPALMLVTRMGVHRAIGTSLLIITAIGFAGAAGALWQGRIDWLVLAPFAVGGAAAMWVGRSLAQRLAGPTLQKIFATLIVLVGAAMLADGLFA
jgi:uncharacterized membrane protein YfcA